MAYLATQYPGESEKKLREHERDWFLQWYQVHSLSLQKAAVAEVLNSIHRIPDFPDLTGWAFGIEVRPCIVSGNDIDPSTAFCVRAARFTRATDAQHEWTKDIGLAGEKASWMTQWPLWAAQNDATDRLIAAIPMATMYHDMMKMDSAPMFTPSREAQLVLGLRLLDPVDHLKRWMPTLRAMILRGHMLGPPGARGDEDVGLRVGRAKKFGDKWAWQPLPDEEARQAGYIEYPGVVGSITQVSG
ncbi:hypothetical protein EVG20_g7652 [Dentipellis fragilis]|uniref:Uncharacterized protein n=1 Tax=Dentipellis fragilis TaxID=205917 RepID=A0A4Y9YFX7_9AGAM|nr:hypothetical protein EVG20_g7652 [Dentipellis fragilis]